MSIPFEPARSYVYKAARYELLPRIAERARSFGDEPFLLRELSRQVLAETYAPEQLEIRIKKAQSDKMQTIRSIFGFYIQFLAENLRVFENLGDGMFKNISIDEATVLGGKGKGGNFEEVVEEDEEFTEHGGESDLGGFACGAETFVEGPEDGVGTSGT